MMKLEFFFLSNEFEKKMLQHLDEIDGIDTGMQRENDGESRK